MPTNQFQLAVFSIDLPYYENMQNPGMHIECI